MSTPKYIRNAGKHWTGQEEKKLAELAKIELSDAEKKTILKEKIT